MANPLQSSRSTFSRESFPGFFAFKEGMWDRQISALLSSPTVSARFLYDLTVPRCGVEFPRRSCGGKGTVLGTAAGGVPGSQALQRLHPDDRLRLLMIDEPLRCRATRYRMVVIRSRAGVETSLYDQALRGSHRRDLSEVKGTHRGLLFWTSRKCSTS